jgi:hypothetical protein
MHFSIFWGVMLALVVTLPLTFGWIRSSGVPPGHHEARFLGFPISTFPRRQAPAVKRGRTCSIAAGPSPHIPTVSVAY